MKWLELEKHSPSLWTKFGDSQKRSLLPCKPKIKGNNKEILHASGPISGNSLFRETNYSFKCLAIGIFLTYEIGISEECLWLCWRAGCIRGIINFFLNEVFKLFTKSFKKLARLKLFLCDAAVGGFLNSHLVLWKRCYPVWVQGITWRLRIEETSILYFITMVTDMWSSFIASSICSKQSFWGGSLDCFHSSQTFNTQTCMSSTSV